MSRSSINNRIIVVIYLVYGEASACFSLIRVSCTLMSCGVEVSMSSKLSARRSSFNLSTRRTIPMNFCPSVSSRKRTQFSFVQSIPSSWMPAMKLKELQSIYTFEIIFTYHAAELVAPSWAIPETLVSTVATDCSELHHHLRRPRNARVSFRRKSCEYLP